MHVWIMMRHHLHSSPSRRRMPHIFMSQHLYAELVRVRTPYATSKVQMRFTALNSSVRSVERTLLPIATGWNAPR